MRPDGGGLLLPATAQAAIIEVGEIPTKNAPSCPATPCQAVSRTTAYQVKVGADRKSFAVPSAGRIVAWSITLGNPGAKQREFFEESLGGASKAGITVLRPGKRLTHTITGQGPQQLLTPYFGQTVQFPLAASLAVRKGDIIALSVLDLGARAGSRPGQRLVLAREPAAATSAATR